MKKTFIYFVAALAIAGCSKNEVTSDASKPLDSNVIGFNTSTGKVSRTNDNGLPQLQDAAGFEVVALKSDGDSWFSKPDGGATYSSTYKWVTDKWSWAKESDDKKWPSAAQAAAYPLTFIVAYPAISVDDFGPWATGGAKYTQAISIGNTDITANEDLLATYAQASEKPVSGLTPLDFKHILSNIQFQIVSPANYKIYIQSLTIKNVAKEGRTYDYNKAFASAYGVEPSPYTTLASYVHMKGDATQKAVELTGLGFTNPKTQGVTIPSGNGQAANTATWKLMPQSKIATWNKVNFSTIAKTWISGTWADFLAANPTILDGAQIELVYRMVDAAGKSVIGWAKNEKDPANSLPATDVYITVAFPLDIAKVNVDKGWEPAKRYTYQISLGTPDASNGTLIDPEYKDESGTPTPDPVDNPKKKPGDDITDTEGYIGFDVIVDPWTNSDQEIK